jgi:tetratricopeptide (TPR) repeat protein
MMKKALPLLLISLILLPLYGAADADPKVELTYPKETEPGKLILIDVILTNTTSEMLWDLKAVIDPTEISPEIKNYIKIVDGEKDFVPGEGDHSINVQDQVSVRLSIETTSNADAGTYKIPLKIKGEIGNCRQGCKPYLLMKDIEFKVIKEYPSLKIELSSYPQEILQGQSINIPFKVSNYGVGYGNNVTLSAPSNTNFTTSLDVDAIGLMKSNESRNVTLNIAAKGDASTGSYKTDIIIEYFDPYGNKKATTEPISFTIKDSALVKEAEQYYAQGNEYFDKKNYSKALEQYENAKEDYQELGLTEKVTEIDARIQLVKSAIESTKSNISPSIYISFGVLLSAVTMELGVLIGTLTRKPKSPKSSSIPKNDF